MHQEKKNINLEIIQNVLIFDDIIIPNKFLIPFKYLLKDYRHLLTLIMFN